MRVGYGVCVKKWPDFTKCKESVSNYKFPPTQTDNINETVISIIQERRIILTEEGQKRIGSATSWETRIAVLPAQ